VRDWFGSEATVPELIQKKKYGKAEKLLRQQFDAGRRDPDLRLQLADVLALDGRGKDAVPIYIGLADEFGRAGNAAKAIGVLKKIERIAPGRAEVADRLVKLIGDHGAAAAEVPAPPEGELEIAAPEPAAAAPASGSAPAQTAAAPEEAVPESLTPALSSPLFGDFSREDLLAVIRGLRFLTFDPGDIIVGDGEPGDSLFVISSGRVKAFVKGASGRYQVARELGEGDFFGEIAILYGRPRTATVTAADRCELLELEKATIETIAASHPRVREVLQSFCNARVGGGV
jgi:cAMP-dependent protein kinase regulator